MTITAFLHTALLVTDLEKADDFYGAVLGLLKVERPLRFPGSWYQIGDNQIHLIATETVTPDIVNDGKWGRNSHIALATTDLNAVRVSLQAAGYPIQLSASGRAALFTRDPDGNVIELSQS